MVARTCTHLCSCWCCVGQAAGQWTLCRPWEPQPRTWTWRGCWHSGGTRQPSQQGSLINRQTHCHCCCCCSFTSSCDNVWYILCTQPGHTSKASSVPTPTAEFKGPVGVLFPRSLAHPKIVAVLHDVCKHGPTNKHHILTGWGVLHLELEALQALSSALLRRINQWVLGGPKTQR